MDGLARTRHGHRRAVLAVAVAAFAVTALGVALAPPKGAEAAPNRGISLTDAAIPASPNSHGATTWAVLIGINDYPHRPSLTVAEADAHAMDKALARLGVPGEQRLVVTGAGATAEGIHTALEWLVDRARQQDTAILFYAGHIDHPGGTTQQIATRDDRSITDEQLAATFANLQARDTWIVMAGCYGGGFDELLAPGRTLTAAAPSGELAYENLDIGQSYLVEYLINRHLQPGETIGDAFAEATADLRREYPTRLPVQFGSADLVVG